MIKNVLTVVGLGITVLMVLHLTNSLGVRLGFVEALERGAYDLRVRLSAPSEPDNRVVIIDLDDRSLQEQGQWPWPRALFAELNDKLFDDYGIDTLGYDITFPEPEARYTDKRLEQVVATTISAEEVLARLRQESGDQVFARSLENRSVVLGYVFERNALDNDQAINAGRLPEPMFEFSEVPLKTILAETNAPLMTHFISNVPTLANTALTQGFFSIAQQMRDSDGIIRRIELLNEYNGQLYGSLALQVFQAFTSMNLEPAEPIVIVADDGYAGLEGIRTLLSDIPLDENAAVYVPYATPGAVYEYIPATDILTGRYKGDISGAIALIGTSAQGLVDLRNTPVAPDLPGVEVHASVISAMLDDSYRVKPSWIAAADFILVCVIGLLFSFLIPRVSALAATLIFAVSAVSVIGVNWYFWVEQLIILTLVPLLLTVSSLYIINMVVGFFSETNARRSTQKMFGLYVPPEVVSEISETKDIFSMKPEKRELTVLFTDVRDFTTVSEGMAPEELSEWMNSFLTPMTGIIHKHGGAIDKYMGDCIMAFWGAPISDPDHAEHGVAAAVEMINYLDVLNAENRKKNWPEVRIGVGLNTGPMSVGNMGSEFRMAYTVLGDAVNLGSRLEGITKQYGVDIIISEFTRAHLANKFDVTELDRVRVKGKNEAVTIFSVDPNSPIPS